MALTSSNYQKGFLIDDELIAGVSEAPAPGSGFIAYVLRHSTGEYLGYHLFESLEAALDAVNRIQRGWKYESAKDCGGCGDAGPCTQGQCGSGTCRLSTCSTG